MKSINRKSLTLHMNATLIKNNDKYKEFTRWTNITYLSYLQRLSPRQAMPLAYQKVRTHIGALP